jgi:hypothetical protein
VTPPRKLTPKDIRAIDQEFLRDYVEQDKKNAIVEEVRVYTESQPPPRALVSVQERVRLRSRSDTDRFDIEELQRELREATERAAADKIAEERRRADDAVRALEKAGDRRWDIVILILTATATAFAGHFIK